MASNLVQRIGFAAVAIPLALGVVWLGGLPLVALICVAGALGTRELFHFAEVKGIRPLRGPGFATAVMIPGLVWLAMESPTAGASIAADWPILAALWLILLLSWNLAVRGVDDRPLGAMALTVFGPLYCAALPAFLIGIRHAEHGTRSWSGTVLVFFPLVVTWICDTAAMFVGKAVGGPKLSPRISPGKTRSGGVGGLLGAVVASVLWNQFALAPFGVAIALWQAVVFGAVLGIIGQIGDLVESQFKREAGLKDSSALIPGHGGVLDRFDSLYFVLPVSAALLHWFGPA
jgi:phosphatidate cytidylyltransferase